MSLSTKCPSSVHIPCPRTKVVRVSHLGCSMTVLWHATSSGLLWRRQAIVVRYRTHMHRLGTERPSWRARRVAFAKAQRSILSLTCHHARAFTVKPKATASKRRNSGTAEVNKLYIMCMQRRTARTYMHMGLCARMCSLKPHRLCTAVYGGCIGTLHLRQCVPANPPACACTVKECVDLN